MKTFKDIESERAYYLYASYLDNLANAMRKSHATPSKNEDPKANFQIAISNYFKSIEVGHTYLWQTLPRILEIWFDMSKSPSSLQREIESNLFNLDTYKIAQVLEILLSRFSNPSCNTTIVKLLSKLAAEYPLQSGWWLYHYDFFHKGNKDANNMIYKADSKKRQKFVEDILTESKTLGHTVCKIPLSSQKEFEYLLIRGTREFMKALIDFAYVQPEKDIMRMEVSKELSSFKFDKYKVIMPIEENLRPRLPITTPADARFS